jgi:hypothetical protein
MTHTEAVHHLERLLREDAGTHKSDRRVGFLRQEEREALCCALGVLHEPAPADDNPFWYIRGSSTRIWTAHGSCPMLMIQGS